MKKQEYSSTQEARGAFWELIHKVDSKTLGFSKKQISITNDNNDVDRGKRVGGKEPSHGIKGSRENNGNGFH